MFDELSAGEGAALVWQQMGRFFASEGRAATTALFTAQDPQAAARAQNAGNARRPKETLTLVGSASGVKLAMEGSPPRPKLGARGQSPVPSLRNVEA